MRYFLLLLALLLAAGPAVAQTVSIAALPDSLPVAQATPDTAAAIHRLFSVKRRTFRYVVFGTIAAAGTAIVVIANASDAERRSGSCGFGFSTDGDSKRLAMLGTSIMTAPVLLVETLFCAGWSRK
jgi:hypothetical protein